MPRKPTGEPDGRPEYDIDWKKVDDLLVAGCLGTEIAAYFGVHPETLYRRIERDKGVGFSEYGRAKRAKGDSILKAAQYDEAVRKRNTTMLVWLGKNRLDQTDKKEINHAGQVAFKVVNYGEKDAVVYHDPKKVNNKEVVEIEAKVEKIETKREDNETK